MQSKQAVLKTFQTFKTSIPMMIGILLLINLINPLLQNFYTKFFIGNFLIDPFIGALGGSFAFGMPITSYVAGGELLNNGVSLLAVTAFIMSWTTVGFFMLPLEMNLLGKKFALTRNLINFIFLYTTFETSKIKKLLFPYML